jgi:hypothetical protein
VILKYCELYTELRGRGMVIPDADLLIASTAIAKGLTLATKDKAFKRLEELGLRMELGESV